MTNGIHQAPKLGDIKICTTPKPLMESGTLTEEEREKIVQAFEGENKMKSTAFVDMRCPVCGGKGRTRQAECVRCKGTGMVGSYEEVEVPESTPDAFAKLFRRLREKAEITLRTASLVIGCTPSRLSDIENGRGRPRTFAETKAMQEQLGRMTIPGSSDAIARGCTCPRANGIYADDCPLHKTLYIPSCWPVEE